ncbi:disulfide bond formation protein DsbB [Alsobacter metallidurans]|uniref:Disulfide bond formation protein DsbB n=1 Tax=Alsobacter metallidurans TaxID=340221 RepID=A0A917MLW3_9HYPH|nr:disulfide bond formation protein B [Alsobacter metallidurans]GGH32529.1 disulfide bond formation protein DsbB [Alsobacter metallidurans]
MNAVDVAASRSAGPLAALKPDRAALAVGLAAAATVGGALVLEHGFGVKPCELCLVQRIPYYVGAPFALLTAIVASRRPRNLFTTAMLASLALLFVISAGLGSYHAGVEWKFWAGPQDCTGAVVKPAAMGDFLKQLETTKVIRCDEVAMRILGLSLAGWNAVISAGLALVAGHAAWRTRTREI